VHDALVGSLIQECGIDVGDRDDKRERRRQAVVDLSAKGNGDGRKQVTGSRVSQ
jgi:hypothetical protein